MATKLLTPILDGGIQSTHFFNGRLLTAEDLRADQVANREHRQRLGRAIGAGVVSGLYVRQPQPQSAPFTVRVSAGLAVNWRGRALALPEDVAELTLAGTATEITTDADIFSECDRLIAEDTIVETGIYILVMSPTSGYRGRAPMHGLHDSGTITGCGSRHAIDGVEFRLVPLDACTLGKLIPDALKDTLQDELADLLKATHDAPARHSKLRNLLAYLCSGTLELANFAVDPFRLVNDRSAYLSYGALDALRDAGRLIDCDVPLAMVHLTEERIEFIDHWSVRRTPARTDLADAWPLLVGQRRRVEAQAVFLQFQEQWEQLVGASATSIAAKDYFRYLPPAGLLRANDETFFSGHPYREPMFIDGVRLNALFRESFDYEPIDLKNEEGVWIYHVWQNAEAIQKEKPVQPYVVFASLHIPPAYSTRFDVARWDYGHFA